LKNIFSPEEDEAFVKIAWQNETGVITEHCISASLSNTQDAVLKKANLSSDFINYKLLQNFYNVTHKQEINLWDVFWRDVFPYFQDNDKNYRELIEELKMPSRRTQAANEQLEENIKNLNDQIALFLNQIQENANVFLKQHFFDNKDVLKIKLQYNKPIDREWIKLKDQNEKSDQPLPISQIKLWVEIYDESNNSWIENHRPHSFLNEAQLTRIAIGIRIGALRTRLQTSDFKVLCIDDMLISLDMSNRRKIAKIILNTENDSDLTYFDDFQKIIFTHDIGFFNTLKYFTTPNDWTYFELNRDENSQNSPIVNKHMGYLEKAQKFFDLNDNETAAMYLRKEIEAILKRYEIQKNDWDSIKQHTELKKKITEIKNKLSLLSKNKFDHVFVKKNFENHILQAFDVENIGAVNLEPADIGKLKSLRGAMKSLLIYQSTEKAEADFLLDQAQMIIDFNLNMNVHDTTLPNYQEEINEALSVVRRLRNYFDKL